MNPSSSGGNRLCGGTNAEVLKVPPQVKPGTLVLLVGPDTGKIVQHLSQIDEEEILVMNARRWLAHEYHSKKGKEHITHEAKVEMLMNFADHLSQEGKTAILHSLGPIGIHHALRWGHANQVHVTTVLAHSLFSKSVKSDLSLKQIIQTEWPVDLILDHTILERGGALGYRSIRQHLKTSNASKNDAKPMPFAMKQLLGAAEAVICHPFSLRASAPEEDDHSGSNLKAEANWYEWRLGPVWPYLDMYDQHGVQVRDIAGVPDVYFNYNDERKAEFERFCREGIWCIGCASYQEFPSKIPNPTDSEVLGEKNTGLYTDENKHYWERFIGWCHIFRNPADYGIPESVPKIFCPQSDFIDPTEYKPDPSKPKIYDFIYCSNKGSWNKWCRNWEIGEPAVKLMVQKYGLKGVLTDKNGDGFVLDGVTTTDHLPGLLETFQSTKFIFVPNIHDASPRVVAEALCCDLPVLMDKDIVGGWHYISPETGLFFENNITDFESKLVQFLQIQKSGGFNPRRWYEERCGPVHSGTKLFDFVSRLKREPIQHLYVERVD